MSDVTEKKSHEKGKIVQRVFVAHKRDYENCLGYLGQRPLKLIANQRYGDEIEWEGGAWAFELDGQIVKDKKLLLDPKDKVQFSIANEFSKQDRHVHRSTLEIYISDFPMELETKEEGIQHCDKGIFIVPPGIGHKIKLSGFTYVLQVMRNDIPIDKDKNTVVF